MSKGGRVFSLSVSIISSEIEFMKLDFVFPSSLPLFSVSPPPYIMPGAFESTCSGKVIIY